MLLTFLTGLPLAVPAHAAVPDSTPRAATALRIPPCNTTLKEQDDVSPTSPVSYLTSFPASSTWGPSDPAGRCYLKRGMSGSAVVVLQYAMKSCYNETALAVDGSFGPATEAALRRTQSKMGITVDGSYGPQTGSHLSWLSQVMPQGSWICRALVDPQYLFYG